VAIAVVGGLVTGLKVGNHVSLATVGWGVDVLVARLFLADLETLLLLLAFDLVDLFDLLGLLGLVCLLSSYCLICGFVGLFVFLFFMVGFGLPTGFFFCIDEEADLLDFDGAAPPLLDLEVGPLLVDFVFWLDVALLSLALRC